MTLDDLLKQCVDQGDAHAAYLLATAQTHNDAQIRSTHLVRDEVQRMEYLKAAKLRGHKQANELLETRHDEEEGNTLDDGKFDGYFESRREINEAIQTRSNVEGSRLFDIALELHDANSSFIRDDSPEEFKAEVAKCQSREDLVVAWIQEAAITSTQARHFLATSVLFGKNFRITKLLDDSVNKQKYVELLETAAFPEQGIKPCYSALVDLAFVYSLNNWPVYDPVKAKKRLSQAIEKIGTLENQYTIRLAELHEQLHGENEIKQRIDLYAGLEKWSSKAAFRAGLLTLRVASTEKEFQISRSHFECMHMLSVRP